MNKTPVTLALLLVLSVFLIFIMICEYRKVESELHAKKAENIELVDSIEKATKKINEMVAKFDAIILNLEKGLEDENKRYIDHIEAIKERKEESEPFKSWCDSDLPGDVIELLNSDAMCTNDATN